MEGTIDAPIGLRNGTTKRTVRGGRMAKEAVTEYKVKKTFLGPTPSSLLEVRPQTGRTHQIRVHLASIGHPIVGDAMYGGRAQKKSAAAGRMMLHALSIEFTAPDGKRIRFEAESPF
jgi:23S rRNA pseudouridine1911/1915/1917 synthase